METKSQKQSIRGKAFIMVEDEALCRAYLAVSQDPVIGTNQSVANFWYRVRSYFSSQRGAQSQRSVVSLSHRWQKIPAKYEQIM